MELVKASHNAFTATGYSTDLIKTADIIEQTYTNILTHYKMLADQPIIPAMQVVYGSGIHPLTLPSHIDIYDLKNTVQKRARIMGRASRGDDTRAGIMAEFGFAHEEVTELSDAIYNVYHAQQSVLKCYPMFFNPDEPAPVLKNFNGDQVPAQIRRQVELCDREIILEAAKTLESYVKQTEYILPAQIGKDLEMLRQHAEHILIPPPLCIIHENRQGGAMQPCNL